MKNKIIVQRRCIQHIMFSGQDQVSKKLTLMNKESDKQMHALPKDLKTAIESSKPVNELWKQITPLAKNEWICWVTSGKKQETRNIRIHKALSKMKSGMRRPCCWAGCPHRGK